MALVTDGTMASTVSREVTLPAIPVALRTEQMTIRVVECGQLAAYVEDWQRLAAVALVPNPFYEPWVLLPAIEHIREGETLRFVLIFGPSASRGGEALLGFFPLEIRRTCLHVPVRTLMFWKHRYCFLSTPLIDSAHAWTVLEVFWRWFERNPWGCKILDTNYLLAEGPFHHVWSDFAVGRCSLVLNDFPRAFLKPEGSLEAYLANTVKKKHADELVRQQRNLARLGRLEYLQARDLSEASVWLDDFLRLEVSGWKGSTAGAAIAKQKADAAFFRELTLLGFARKQVMLLSLTLNGKAIAMKHNLLACGGGFTVRIAYDEDYSRYSPGVLLEMENMRRAFEDPRIHWMDSCADPRHVMANRIWNERRMIRRTLFSDSSRLGDLSVSALPLLRWTKKLVYPEAVRPHLQISTKMQRHRSESRC